MPAFIVANPKGGSGKSTLATNLAGYFASRGHRVMLGDVDRQQSSALWLARRPEILPGIETWEVDKRNIARPPAKTTHVVLDTPAGLHGKLLEKILGLSARIIVPVQPSLLDIAATKDFLDELRAAKSVIRGKTDVAVVGMRVAARTRSAAELEAFFETLDLPVITHLRNTQLYVQAVSAGMTLFDLPAWRVERELDQWRPLIEWAER